MYLIKPAFLLLFSLYSEYLFSQAMPADSSQKDTVLIEEIIIYANRIEMPYENSIQQINYIKPAQITNLNAQNTASLIENAGVAYVQKSQAGGGSIILRGFEANRIVLMIDGVRMNNLIYRGGHLQNIITIDNASIDRVELLNGSASTLYGSDALGGVICMYTRKPKFSLNGKTLLKGNAFFRYGLANNELTGHAELNTGTKRFASLTAVTYSKFSDLRMGDTRNPFYKKFGERTSYADRINGKDSLVNNNNPLLQKFSGYSQYDVLQKFLLKQNAYIQHQVNVQFSNSTDIPRYDRLTDPGETGLKSAEWYYGPQTRVLTAYDLYYAKEDAFFSSIHASVNYQYLTESRHNRDFGKVYRADRTEHVHVLGYYTDLTKQFRDDKIIFGMDGQFSTVKSVAAEEEISTGTQRSLYTRYPDGKNNMNIFSLYASHIGKYGKHITVNDGIRIGYSALYSTFNDTTFFNFPFKSVNQNTFTVSGNIGILYAPTRNWKIAFLLNTGFRAPNVDDLSKVFESAAGKLIIPNAALKPEKTVSSEINITKQFGNSVRWENVFWATYFMDAIQTEKYSYNGFDSINFNGINSAVYANQNTGKAYLLGYSSSINVNFNKYLSATFSINYTYGRLLTDTSQIPLDHIAPLYGRIGMNYHSTKLYIELYSLFNGWKRRKDYSDSGEDNLQYATEDGMPAWFTLNLKASYRPHKNITLLAGLENLADTRFRTFASGINAPGINIYLSFRVNW